MRRALTEPPLVRGALLAVALVFLAIFLVMPLVAVFAQALEKGFGAYLTALREPDAWAAIRLTLLTAAIAVPMNLAFGLAASWAIAKFEFPGKGTLLTLIDLPFAVSPVISGMIFVLLFGRQGLLGPFLGAHDVKVIFAVPGIVLATVFVTFPFVARELVPVGGCCERLGAPGLTLSAVRRRRSRAESWSAVCGGDGERADRQSDATDDRPARQRPALDCRSAAWWA